MQLVAALLATLALGHAEPAVTVTAAEGARVIERGELSRWTRAEKDEQRALDILIRSAWVEGEARELGIVVTPRQVRARLRAEGSRPTPKGLTRPDVVRVRRADLLLERMRERIGTAAAQSVTQAQIDAYAQAHPRTEPETRTLRVVLTRAERDGRAAKRALSRGAGWRTVTRRYSIDRLSSSTGGLYPEVPRDHFPARAARAAFDAKQGQLVGPIKTQSGYYLMKVVAIIPEHPTPLETLRALAWEILASEAQQAAFDAFETNLAAKWRPRTVCAADLAAHHECGNT